MNRKQFCGIALGLVATAVAGCGGGGDDNNRNDTESINNPGAGSVTDLSRMTVFPGQKDGAFIGQNTGFVLSWATATDAPRTTRVALYRFLEARGGETRSDFREDIRIAGNTVSSWSVRKQSDLFAGGVFYLDVSTDLDRKRYAFIVGGGRSIAPSDEPTRAADVNTPGTTIGLGNLTVRYSGDATGAVNIPVATPFVLDFGAETNAPARFTVRLRRYKERRGTEEPSANEQNVDVSHDAGTGQWTVRRSDNFLLERGATYILEVVTDGETQRNYVFLTEG
ncbi:MAG: hypothetical protein H7Y38_02260 [Armatimonadetes bacterium]|nr:hypothetical protein [Armatimonadota bacterium]